MKGSYTIKVYNHRVTFTLEIERNITVITGNSATGKTTLIDSISAYEELGSKSGVSIESKKECHVIRGKNWYDNLIKIKDSFVFIDEGSAFVKSKDFAKAIRESDNYYILVTRENLYQLPYSVNSILELHKTSSRFKHTYNRTYPRYESIPTFTNELQNIDQIITEDSNSGYEMFLYIASSKGIHCISAGGRNGIYEAINNIPEKKKLVVADGAAFGSNMAAVYRYVETHKNETVLYLPESFEWIILASGVVGDEEIDRILDNPPDYIESSQFFSWERFFTYLLEEKTKGKKSAYSKNKLSDYFLHEGNVKKIVEIIEKGREK